jgi:hypothetical protein
VTNSELPARPDQGGPALALYDFADTDEMGLAALAAYSDVRSRLVAHFAYDPHLQRTAAGIVDELARELIESCEEDEDDPDD